MADEKVLQQAKVVFDRFKAYLDGINWSYETDTKDGKFMIITGVSSDDLPIKMYISVGTRSRIISVFSQMPFKFGKDSRIDGAVATSIINHAIADGSFDYDVTDGTVLFRMTTSWAGGQIADDVFEYLIAFSSSYIDKYNDKLFMVAKGMLSLEDFAKFVAE